MTDKTEGAPAYGNVAVGDLITIAPKGVAVFEVVALDEIDHELVYAYRVDRPQDRAARCRNRWHVTEGQGRPELGRLCPECPEQLNPSAQWYSLTYARHAPGMSAKALADWFIARGVEAGSEWLDELLEWNAGRTEAEMTVMYAALHA